MRISEKYLENNRNLYIVIIVIAIIGYWPVSFLVSSFKWDALQISVPWRYFIGECLNNGYLPLWYPYQCMGFGQYLDNQTWYWISWMFSIGGYSNLTFHYEYLFHIICSGIGFYLLAKHLGVSRISSIIFSIAYIFSGFYIGNAQHFGWIVSATWIPFVTLSYLKLNQTLKLKYVFLTAIFFYLLISGGYWGFTLVVFYYILFHFVFQLISHIKNKKVILRHYLESHLLLFFVSLVLSSVIILSVYDSLNLISRGDSLTTEHILESSLVPRNLLTLIVPFATYMNWDWWITDVSMINLYIGVFTFVIIIVGVKNMWNNKTLILLFTLSMFFLIVSMGQTFPVRQWLNYLLPGFSFIRFPAQYRYYSILLMLLYAGIVFDNLMDSKIIRVKNGVKVFMILCSITVVAIFLVNDNFFKFLWADEMKESLNFIHTVAFQLIALLILSAIYLMADKILRNRLSPKMILGLFIIIDIVAAAQLNMGHTVVKLKKDPFLVKSEMRISGFPMPDIDCSLKDNEDEAMKLKYFVRNNATFCKVHSFNGYTPYQYKRWNALDTTQLFQMLINRPLIYSTIGDSIDKNVSIKVTDFGPNHIQCIVESKHPSTIHLQQNFHKDWFAEINYSPVEIKIDNIALMKIDVPKGKSRISFVFKPEKIIYSFWLSITSFGLSVLIVTFLIFRNKQKLI